jgi:hypothetical protein
MLTDCYPPTNLFALPKLLAEFEPELREFE